MSIDAAHVPVMPAEVLDAFREIPAGWIVDCTLGLAGHSDLLLKAHPNAKVLGLDVDAGNLDRAKTRLTSFGDRFQSKRANFADIEKTLRELGIAPVAAILADLGVSSNQISDAARGLSFDTEGPLDMRLDDRQKTTAADLLNSMGEGELADLLYLQSQERGSRRIAKRICQARRQFRLNSTIMLARLVAAALGENPDSHRGKIHPATRTFMALRMAVNRETDALTALLEQAPRCLQSGGRIAVISFHSVEDKLVKESFKAQAAAGLYKILTKKPLTASEQEERENPRSRSAKLRIAEKI